MTAWTAERLRQDLADLGFSDICDRRVEHAIEILNSPSCPKVEWPFLTAIEGAAHVLMER